MSATAGARGETAVTTRRELPAYSTNHVSVVVIGHTVAGLRTALALAANGSEVTIIGEPKPPRVTAGFNADTDWAGHAADTLRAGRLLNDSRQSIALAIAAPAILEEIVDYHGCTFERDPDGSLKTTQLDGHTTARTHFGIPDSGTTIFETLQQHVRDTSITVNETLSPTMIGVNEDTTGGVFGIDTETGTRRLLVSPAVIIADGDYTGLYDEGSGGAPGLSLAFNSGARLREMEFTVFDDEDPMYTLGGLDVDVETGETCVDGLFAVGDAAGGWNGAASLPGNRLLVDLVSADITAEAIQTTSLHGVSRFKMKELVQEHLQGLNHLFSSTGPVSAADLLSDLRAIVQKHAGKPRSGSDLFEGVEALIDIREQCVELGVPEDPDREEIQDVLDLQTLLLLAEPVFRAAIERAETRAHHVRTDFEETMPGQDHTLICEVSTFGVVDIQTRPLPEVPEEVQERFES